MTPKILILSDSYFPLANANGVCVQQLASALMSIGYNVHVYALQYTDQELKEEIGGVMVHRSTHNFGNFHHASLPHVKKNKINVKEMARSFKNKLYVPFYPLPAIKTIKWFCRDTQRLNEAYGFDCILSVCHPFHSLVAGLLMKRKSKDSCWMIYTLDSLSNGMSVSTISDQKRMKKGWQWEKFFYKYADAVFNLRCNEKHYAQPRYDFFRFKMFLVDIPLFNRITIHTKASYFDKSKVHFVYSGSLAEAYRNPQYLCQLFTEINKNERYCLHFYSKGCENFLEQLNEKENGIMLHGYVSREEALGSMLDADVLVSIGNRVSDMIPSKIFEYMSAGRKIIHLFQNEKDAALPYLKQYPYALLIDENGDFNSNVKNVIEFVNKDDPEMSFDEMASLFEENRPMYTVRQMDDILKKVKV